MAQCEILSSIVLCVLCCMLLGILLCNLFCILPCILQCVLLCILVQYGSKVALNCPTMVSKIAPKLFPNRVGNGAQREQKATQNGANMGLGGDLGRSKICSGGLWPLGGLLEGSWKPLGPTKSTLDRLLAALRKIPRQFSAIIGAKRAPKWTPGGGQNGVQNRVSLKMPKS